MEKSKHFSKMTKTLLGSVFGREILAKSTLAKKKKNKDGELTLDNQQSGDDNW